MKEGKAIPEMNVMLNELRTRFGRDPQWSAHIAQAERLHEGQDRFGLTTIYDLMMNGALPWTPENVQRLKQIREHRDANEG